MQETDFPAMRPCDFHRPMAPNDKKQIRQAMRVRRRALDPVARRRAARDLAARLARLGLYGSQGRVAFYFACDGEIDLAPAMSGARAAGVRCMAPVVPRPGRRVLRFAEIGPRLRPNRFGIPEPCVPPAVAYPAAELDCILVPLVAFDGRGNRLGMGGGFYDATLAARRRFTRPAVIGVAHECQRMERIETDPWDVPIDRIVTDRRVYEFT